MARKKKKSSGRRRSRGARPAGGGGGFRRSARSAGRRMGTQVKSFLSGFNLLEDILFFLVGWYFKPALTQTGIPWLLYDHIPQYKEWVDSAWNHGLKSAADMGGAGLISKVGGFGAISKVLYDSATGSFGAKDKNVFLPLGLGLMADPDPVGGMGSGYTGGNW